MSCFGNPTHINRIILIFGVVFQRALFDNSITVAKVNYRNGARALFIHNVSLVNLRKKKLYYQGT